MANTRTQVRAAIYARETMFGFAATADSVGTTYVADASMFDAGATSRLGLDQESDKFIYRPATTGDDIFKRTGQVDGTTGRLSHAGSDYSDTTTLPYEFVGMLPDRINAAIQQGQKLQVSRTTLALTTITDFDMETALTANWSSSSATLTKVSTAGNVFTGTQSLHVLLSGAGGYAQSATTSVQPSWPYRVGIRARCAVGTVTLQVYDITNSVLLAENVSYAGPEFAVLWLPFTTPATCKQIAIRIVGTGASDDIYVDTGFGPYWRQMRRMALPSYMDESYRLRLLRPFRHRMAIAPSVSSSTGQVWQAASREYVGDWEKPEYDVEVYDRDVQPYNLVLQKDIWDYPYEMLVERDLWQTEPLDTEAATTSAPIDNVVIHAIYCLLLDVTRRNKDPELEQMLAEYKARCGARDVAKVPQTRIMESPYFAVSARGRGAYTHQRRYGGSW